MCECFVLFNIRNNFTALSTTSNVVSVMFVGWFFDLLRRKTELSNTFLSKLASALGSYLPSLTAIILMFVGCDITMVVILTFSQFWNFELLVCTTLRGLALFVFISINN